MGNQDFCFDPNAWNKSDAIRILTSYFHEREHKLKDKATPIFLDTNILLAYYGLRSEQKEKFLAFIRSRDNQIKITNQVFQEYLTNRPVVITNDYIEPTRNFHYSIEKLLALNKTIINAIQSSRNGKQFINLLENLEKCVFELESKIQEEEGYQGWAEQINLSLNDIYQVILKEDELYKLINDKRFLLKGLKSNEISSIKSRYGELIKKYKTDKDSKIFPGAKDSDKNRNAEGDFIIFHEMIKYAKEENTSLIFYTNDLKEDWLDGFHPPFHYICKVNQMTGNHLFIEKLNKKLYQIDMNDTLKKNNRGISQLSILFKKELDDKNIGSWVY